jgi:(1->4)-alpha-D-glucan 1-alpha-D-glucosylmutase
MRGPRSKSKYGATSGHRVRSHTAAAEPRSRRLLTRRTGEPAAKPNPADFSPALHRVPGATYRFQFNRDFTFQQARELVGYLNELGITDLYSSPIFQSGPNSTHGYDTCGYDRLNAALGSEQEFRKLATELRQHGMGLLLDMVPNHMAADCSNRWWRDVLDKGPGSSYAWWFDINWKPLNPLTHGKVLLPILEDHYFRVLEAGKLKLVHQDERFAIEYHDRQFPLSPISSRMLKQQLAKRGLDFVLKEFNGRRGEPLSFQQLHALLKQQHYRFAYWRIGSEEINYRRFFDVADLVSLRIELPEVFEGAHEFLFQLLEEGLVTGLRIDHPDGLWDPKRYCERLQEKFAGIVDPDQTVPWSNQVGARGPLYIIVEKILCGHEELPQDWPVNGTTGYDFLNRVNGLFVDGANEKAFDRIYRQFTGVREQFSEAAYRGKKLILERSLVSEVCSAVNRLKQIAVQTRYGQDLTTRQLRTALIETIACFPVYRSYIGDATLPSAQDGAHITAAVNAAVGRNPDLDRESFRFLQNVLLLEAPPDATGETEGRIREFVLKFQQLTGPATAKGVEDTAFYNYNRLLSLNEVGGEPGRFGITPAEFHESNLRALGHWPHTLLATSTHDTKRGEDSRARINVLSEMPQEWGGAVDRWRELNRPAQTQGAGRQIPSANDEYLFYQSLIGAWTEEAETPNGLAPLRERMCGYMEKAIRESKAHTSWTDPNQTYEAGVRSFTERLLRAGDNSFLNDFRLFHKRVAYFGHLNSLSQTLLKLTSPGVPDIYQGSELWDFNLVDPDNRRPVDYKPTCEFLRDLKHRGESKETVARALINELQETWEDGRIKLFLVWRALRSRRDNELLFRNGGYVPLSAVRSKAQHVLAFARTSAERFTITIVPRLYYKLLGGVQRRPTGGEVWGDTQIEIPRSLKGTVLHNLLTGEHIPIHEGALEVSRALASFPVALLASSAAA